MERSRQLDHGLVASFFIAMKMPLQFGVNIAMAKDPYPLFES
jgi:hypothetical protein